MAKLDLPSPIVSINWLADHLQHPQLIILDASLLPVTGHSSYNTDLQIPGTRVFDFDKRICDQESALPHMMPTPEFFVQEVRALGVCSDSIIVVYDRFGVYSSPRAWWMFKAMGHTNVAVLDGGLPAWLDAGLPCEPRDHIEQPFPSGNFVAHPCPDLFCDADQVSDALTDPHSVVIDARSKGRFLGLEPEPRTGLRSGHMPNARNLPFTVLQSGPFMVSIEELTSVFSAIADRQQRLIFSCGSGVSSCILALGAELAGYTKLTVYDGSWSEWGAAPVRAVVKSVNL